MFSIVNVQVDHFDLVILKVACKPKKCGTPVLEDHVLLKTYHRHDVFTFFLPAGMQGHAAILILALSPNLQIEPLKCVWSMVVGNVREPSLSLL